MDQNLKDILDTVLFIKERMLTKDEGATKADIAELRKTLDDIDKRLDLEALQRHAEKLPARVSALEDKVIGASQEPAHP